MARPRLAPCHPRVVAAATSDWLRTRHGLTPVEHDADLLTLKLTSKPASIVHVSMPDDQYDHGFMLTLSRHAYFSNSETAGRTLSTRASVHGRRSMRIVLIVART